MSNMTEYKGLLKALVAYRKSLGEKTIYRTTLTRDISRITKKLDPSARDDEFGFHVSPMMEEVATELGGTFTKDLTKNGNAKKNTVRIEF